MELGLGRIVNFSDAAVAIALPLLVLPLVGVASQIKEHGGMWPLFTTNMLSYSPDADRAVNALYIGTLLATSATMLLLEWMLKRTPGLLRPDSAAALDLTNAATSTALFVVVLALVVVFPGVGMLWLLLPALSGPLGAAARRGQRRASEA